MLDIANVQRRLIAAGFPCGPSGADGVLGRATISAITAFQAARKLTIKWPGTLGPITLAALNAIQIARLPKVAERDPVWLAEGRRFEGLHEVAGRANNPTIMQWGQDLAGYTGDDIPWCGLFIHHCIAATLPHERMIANPLWARGWLNFGRKIAKPSLGAILVFERGPTSGHVAMYLGEDATRYKILGGNQSDSVSETTILKSRLIGIRHPLTVEALTTPIDLKLAGPVSQNEA